MKMHLCANFSAGLCATLTSLLCSAVYAEVVLDGTLGQTGALAGPNYQVTADLGQQAGGNLFHSFSQLNLQTGESATFSGPDSVSNIISRVTGGKTSFINGMLSSDIAGAGFYLFNPAGVQFGEQASLNLGSSFYVSSADYLRLTDDLRFSAQPNSIPSNLSNASPAAFGFINQNSAPVSFTDSQLSLTNGQHFLVAGGPINLDGSQLKTASGTIQLLATQEPGELATNAIADITNGADIQLNASELEVSQTVGGSLFIHGGDVQLQNSALKAKTRSQTTGQVQIQAKNLSLDNTEINTKTFGTGDAGTLQVNAKSMTISNAANLNTSTAGSGQGGKLTVNVTDKLTINKSLSYAETDYPFSGLFSNSENQEGPAGDAGTIEVNVGSLEISDAGTISSTSYGSGQGGNINIQVANDAHMRSGGTIITGTLEGDSGSILLHANGLLSLSGQHETGRTSIFSDTYGKGRAGNLNIQANNIELGSQARLSSSSFGSGTGGDIQLLAQNIQMKDNAGLYSSSESTAADAGNGGNIYLQTETLTTSNQAVVSSITAGSGNAGQIQIDAENIHLTNGGGIASASQSTETYAGNSGNILLNVNNALDLTHNAQINTEAKNAGGGQILINTQQRLYAFNSKVTSSVQRGAGSGGDIQINRPRFVVLNNGQLLAQAFDGNGGNIQVQSQRLLLSHSSAIDATSQRGVDGEVVIESPQSQFTGELIPPATELLTQKDLEQTPCAEQEADQSRFILTSAPGVPNAVDDWLPSGFHD
ncbi:two-partner secretion domain-containing protein [Candidatus Venteria ishoeyi]|uniref:Haemagglutination activity domain protein n=1 Tax=Candidatus Venteria ishoeyi TaxID=1899563 RepID=A0A1H6FBZ8_9GAMM|nr:filamentous hemagglutinin N-terminal domain-containing protein [Candidatus Venteria ishoeyi]SEH06564.1 haemagglutination activity domain protein [Candidatus Venteria ishoeyi]